MSKPDPEFHEKTENTQKSKELSHPVEAAALDSSDKYQLYCSKSKIEAERMLRHGIIKYAFGQGIDSRYPNIRLLSENELSEKFSEMLSFDIPNKIFNAFHQSHNDFKFKKFNEFPDEEAVVNSNYDYDHLNYHCQIRTFFPYRHKEFVKCLSIKLSNDGFLYTADDDPKLKLHLFRNTEKYLPYPGRHHKPYNPHYSTQGFTWCKLKKEYEKHFSNLIDFSENYFRQNGKTTKYTSIWYNYHFSRIDFEMQSNDNYRIQITYEPGLPNYDYEDYWEND